MKSATMSSIILLCVLIVCVQFVCVNTFHALPIVTRSSIHRCKPTVLELCATTRMQGGATTTANNTTAESPITTTPCDSSSSSKIRSVVVPPGILGPPEGLRRLEVGQSLAAFRTSRNFTIERVSLSPDVFVLRKSHRIVSYRIVSLPKFTGCTQY